MQKPARFARAPRRAFARLWSAIRSLTPLDLAAVLGLGRRPALARRRYAPRVEGLEDRAVPSVNQWADRVIGFSSQYGPGNWSAASALGAPNTFTYGDRPTAWAPAPMNGSQEYLTVGFATPVYATGVTIRETYGNGFVTRVDVVDTNNVYHPVWVGTDPSAPGNPADFAVAFPATRYLVKGVKVHVNTNHSATTWEEIDAVELRGETTSPNTFLIRVNDATHTDEDAPLASTVLAAPTDADGDPLSVALVSGVSQGTLDLRADGSFDYVPRPNFHGVDSFVSRITDGFGGEATVTVFITVDPANDAPVAADDSVFTAEDVALKFDPRANDTTGPDVGETLAVIGFGQPTHGTVRQTLDGCLIYTPAANYYGPDTFTYTLSDGNGGTATATVSVLVTPENDAPTAGDDDATLAEDTSALIDVLANDSAAPDEGETLSIRSYTNGLHGTVTIEEGRLRYTPNANYYGPDRFTYALSDNNGGVVTATVTITVTPVNDAPTVRDDVALTPEDTPVSVDVRTNDTAAPDAGETLSLVSFTQGAHGTVALVGGQLVYTPAADYHGPDTFTYTMSDGNGGTATGTVRVTVGAVNDTPTPGNPLPGVSTGEDGGDAVVDLTGAFTDPDGENLDLAVTGNTNPGLVTATLDGTDLRLQFAANASGTATITVRATDGAGEYAEATLLVTVAAVNDAPTAAVDAALTAEDTAVTIDVLGNDATAPDDGETLAVASYTNGANGTVALVNGRLVYTPRANFHGVDQFLYTAADGNGGRATAVVTVTVTPVNDAPTAGAAAGSTTEDVAVGGDLRGNVGDVDGDPLTFTVAAGPAHGVLTLNPNGTYTYTPAAGYSGSDAFTYQVEDGRGGVATAVVSLTVAPRPNRAPVTEDDAWTATGGPLTGNVLANDSDPDGDALTASVFRGPANGTLTLHPDGSFTYTPNAGFTGTDSFTYHAADGRGGTAAATVTLTVTAPSNRPPVAAAEFYEVGKNKIVTGNVLANDADPDGHPLTAVLVTGPKNGTLKFNADGSFTYTPKAGFVGDDGFTYRVSDGNGGTATATVGLRVVNVKDLYASQLLTVSGAQYGLLIDVRDLGKTAVTAVNGSGANVGKVLTLGSGARLTVYNNGLFKYEARGNKSTPDRFTVTLKKGTTLTPYAFVLHPPARKK